MTTAEIVTANHHRAAHAARRLSEWAARRALLPGTSALEKTALVAIAAHVAVAADAYEEGATEEPVTFDGVIVANMHPFDASIALLEAEFTVAGAVGNIGIKPDEITDLVHGEFKGVPLHL